MPNWAVKNCVNDFLPSWAVRANNALPSWAVRNCTKRPVGLRKKLSWVNYDALVVSAYGNSHTCLLITSHCTCVLDNNNNSIVYLLNSYRCLVCGCVVRGGRVT